MKIALTVLLVSTGLLATQYSVANEPLTPAQKEKIQATLEERFQRADANHDGLVTRPEAKGIMPRLYRHFDKVDLDHSGAVSLEEIRQAADQLRAAHFNPMS